MLMFIIWVIGLILTIKAALEILRLNGDTVKKLLFVILILLTSWVGLIFYYFVGRKEIPGWVK